MVAKTKKSKPKVILCEVCRKPIGPRGIKTENGIMHYGCQVIEG